MSDKRTTMTVVLFGLAVITASCVSIGSVQNRANHFFSSREFKEGLEVYRDAYKQHQDQRLLEKYYEAAEKIRQEADQAYEKENFFEAGGIYNALLQNGAPDGNSRRVLAFDDTYLKARIEACCKSLTETGLKKYREERLDEAISIWKEALTLDRENAAIKKAISTANRQLLQLKKSEKSSSKERP